MQEHQNHPNIRTLKRKDKADLAYIKNEGDKNLPTVVFLGGFRSDMMGTKAQFLEKRCSEHNQTFIRFDYSGHGLSGGAFEEGCISDWKEDALAILEYCANNSAILIGSSMGGWIALLIALQHPKHVHALIGLAAAPDFTIWMEQQMNAEQENNLKSNGYFELANDYDDTPYIITRRLIEDGRKNLILNKRHQISLPVRLIQGKKDTDVPWKTADKIRDSIINNDVEITYIKEADHRLSTPGQLEVLDKTLRKLV